MGRNRTTTSSNGDHSWDVLQHPHAANASVFTHSAMAVVSRSRAMLIATFVLALGLLLPSPSRAGDCARDPALRLAFFLPPLSPSPKTPSEQLNETWRAIKCLADTADRMVAIIGKINTGIAVATAIADAAGLLGPSELERGFQALHEHLDYITATLYGQARANNRNNWLASSDAAVTTAYQSLVTVPKMPFAITGDPMQSAASAVNAAAKSEEFLEFKGGREAYEWRFGVPALMHLIANKLKVNAAFLEHWPKSDQVTVFRMETEVYRAALVRERDNMVNGVYCWPYGVGGSEPGVDTTPLEITMNCLEVYSGLWRAETFPNVPPWEDDDGVYDGVLVEERVRNSVLREMPVFEMRSLIDELSLYLKPELAPEPEPDICLPRRRTPVEPRIEADSPQRVPGRPYRCNGRPISVAAAPSLCLDVKRGSSEPNPLVEISNCNGDPSQDWVYDRENDTIRNPAFNKCLDVQWSGLTSRTPVWLWDCNGTEAQRWTHDPETGVLQNALGTVLDIQGGALQQGTQVWTWSRDAMDMNPGQRWKIN